MKRIFLAILIALIVIALGAFLYVRSAMSALVRNDAPVFFTVQAGESVTSVAQDLQDRGIIASAAIFKIIARLSESATIQAADYDIQPGITVRQLFNDLSSGRAVSAEKQVTLVEGLTLEQMATTLAEAGIVADASAFITAATVGASAFTAEYDFLASKPAEASLEGYLFPDTYRFFPNSEPQTVIRRLLDHFGTVLTDDLLADIARSGRTVHETVILASIVEKEVRGNDHMRVVAGIFANRLDIGMALQADSTVNYLTKSGRARSTYADLEIDSPYNTYKYAGLPAGPISNPGLNALAAAADPADTPYLFFLTDEAGTVYYGRDLSEHNRNRELYL